MSDILSVAELQAHASTLITAEQAYHADELDAETNARAMASSELLAKHFAQIADGNVALAVQLYVELMDEARAL